MIVSEAINGALEESIMAVTAEWRKLKKSADRERRVSQRAIDEEQKRQKAKVISVKEAAWQVMEDAYLKASDGGRCQRTPGRLCTPRAAGRGDCRKYWKNSSTFKACCPILSRPIRSSARRGTWSMMPEATPGNPTQRRSLA